MKLHVALYNEGFVPIPTLLGNQSQTSLLSCSLILPLWPGEGRGKGMAFVPGWSRESPGRPKTAIHPGQRWKWHFPCWDETLQAGVPLGGQKIPRPKGSHLPRIQPRSIGEHLCSLRSSVPSEPQRGGKLPWRLLPCQLLGLESRKPIPRWLLEWKVERKPLIVGSWADSRPSPPPRGKPSPISPSCPHLGNPVGSTPFISPSHTQQWELGRWKELEIV